MLDEPTAGIADSCWLKGLAFTSLLASGCAMSLGGTGSEALSPKQSTHAGISGSGVLAVPVFNTDMDLAAGVQSQVMQRVHDGNHWGDWRLQALVGMTQMPRRHEPVVGYEIFVLGGLGRFTEGDKSDVGAAYGLLAGLPMRLKGYEPPWRADDLVGYQLFLVPALGANGHDLRGFEVNGTLSLRLALWSAITP